MQIVIDIPDKDYEKLKDGHISFSILNVMQNGTPLPKGHGDLKDIETFKLTYGNEGAYYRFKDVIDAPTIIEADEEEKK